MFLSLRTRLCLAICGLLTAAVFASAAAFIYFSRDQLLDERENCIILARQFASTLNHVLASSAEPHKTLVDFVADMNSLSPGRVGYVPANTPPMDMLSPAVKGVPQWFTDLLAIASPAGHDQFPIVLNGTRLGDLVVMPDSSADIYEKWVTLLAILGSALVLALLASVIVYFTLGAALQPIYQLSDALALLRTGDYRVQVAGKPPKEFEKSFVSLNELAATLARLREQVMADAPQIRRLYLTPLA